MSGWASGWVGEWLSVYLRRGHHIDRQGGVAFAHHSLDPAGAHGVSTGGAERILEAAAGHWVPPGVEARVGT